MGVVGVGEGGEGTPPRLSEAEMDALWKVLDEPTALMGDVFLVIRRILAARAAASTRTLSASGSVTLTDFLLARIAEDEARYCGMNGGFLGDMFTRLPAECEAKRRIVATLGPFHDEDDDTNAAILAGSSLRALALPYADHPDYREEWRP